jgi:hypothetical protein
MPYFSLVISDVLLSNQSYYTFCPLTLTKSSALKYYTAMDPYSARRHALYQPRGPAGYEFDYGTNPDPQKIQQIEEPKTSWYGGALGIDFPETTHESHDGNIPFLPATQPAKRIRIESVDSLIPMEVRTEVFALLSGACLDEFLEIRNFLQRSNHTPASGSKFTDPHGLEQQFTYY